MIRETCTDKRNWYIWLLARLQVMVSETNWFVHYCDEKITTLSFKVLVGMLMNYLYDVNTWYWCELWRQNMSNAGKFPSLFPMSDLSVMGLIEVLPKTFMFKVICLYWKQILTWYDFILELLSIEKNSRSCKRHRITSTRCSCHNWLEGILLPSD